MKPTINQFKPKIKGISDKYSCQLYEYLRRNYGRFQGLPNVYYIQTQDRWNSELEMAEQIEVPFDSIDLKIGHIFVGENNRDGWYSANRLSNILGDSKEKYTIFAIPWFKNKTVIDITDWFWDEYRRIGRCVWDRPHIGWLMDDDERFVYINKNSRKCQWCGEWQHREIEKRVKIERKPVWIAS
jgi:hypothetical protein